MLTQRHHSIHIILVAQTTVHKPQSIIHYCILIDLSTCSNLCAYAYHNVPRSTTKTREQAIIPALLPGWFAGPHFIVRGGAVRNHRRRCRPLGAITPRDNSVCPSAQRYIYYTIRSYTLDPTLKCTNRKGLRKHNSNFKPFRFEREFLFSIPNWRWCFSPIQRSTYC